MKFWRWLIAGGIVVAVLLTAFLLWQLPTKQDMARTVPAETLVYLEANDLPQVFRALTETEAWRELAPVYGIESDYGQFGSFSQTLAGLNIGSTETVIFGRSQIAVALLGVGARDGAESSLSLKPQFAVVVETKSGRAGSLVNNQAADFARRQFGEVKTEKKNSDGAEWTIFRATADERNLFAVVTGTTAIIGNDEAAVQACLDVKNGRRKSLADDENLAKMRANTESDSAFAFGYVTPEGVKQLSQIGAVLAAGQLSEDPRAMSLLAQSLPPFLQKTVTAIGWTARKNADKIEDRFFVQMPPDLVSRLREPLAVGDGNSRAAEFLPENVQTVTLYNFKNAQSAWRGTALALTSKLDMVSAAVFSQAVGGLLAPYGATNADEFLSAAKGELNTARLSADDNSTVAIVGVSDAEKIKKVLRSDGDKKSEFAGDTLLLGGEESLSLCRAAREQNKTLKTQDFWREFSETKLGANQAFVRTLSQDRAAPSAFVKIFGKEQNAKTVAETTNAPHWAWAISETRLVREGFERRTVSAFGFIGTLANSFADN
jgi:hypothetical protein